MSKYLLSAVALTAALGLAGAAVAAPKNGNGGPQGGGPGASGTGDKASGKASFFATHQTGTAPGNGGPQGGGPGTSGTGDKNSNRNGVSIP